MTEAVIRKIEIVCVVVALIISALAAYLSAVAIRETKEATIRQANYQMRREALVSYSQAYATYDAALHQIMADQKFDIEEPPVVNKLTMKDLEVLRLQLSPIVSTKRAAWAIFRASLPAWPLHVRDLMQNAGKKGDEVALCYESAVTRVLTPEELKQVKQELNANCRDLGRKHYLFEQMNNAAIDDMIKEVYNAEAAVGVNPEDFSPDIIHKMPKKAVDAPFS